VFERQQERELYRRQQRRGRRRIRFAYPVELRELPNFVDWVLDEVNKERQEGVQVDAHVLDTARGPLHIAAAYKAMYAYGNHFRVRSSE